MKTIINFLTILLITTQVVAKNNSKKYDKLLNEMFDKNGPGAVALVVKDGKTLYRKAFGKANIELNVDMAPENVFRIGSITKQFTATAIMQLVEQGKVKLDANITEYIKDYPTHGHIITIEHLLTHTSGVKSYTSLKKWTPEVQKKDFTPEEMVDYFKSEPMNFAPGDQFKYSNSGYFLLGQIIENVSGQSYADYINEHIFQPLGMKNSYYGSHAQIIKNRASGYAKGEEGYKNDKMLSMTQPFSAGSLLSTVDDLSTWYTAVMANKVMSAASRKKAHSPYTLNKGKISEYGYGWNIGNIQGSPMISHNGGINGFLSVSNYLIDEKVFVVILSNCICNYPGEIAEKMAAIAIDKPYAWKQITLAEDLLKSYVAVYSSDDNGDRIITYKQGKLYSMRTGGKKYEILPFAKDKFYFDGDVLTLEFNRNENNEIISIILKSTNSDKQWLKTDKPIPTITKIKIDADLLNKYLGKYAFEMDKEFQMKISLKGNKIISQATNQSEREIIPTAKHTFNAVDLDARFVFELDEDGIVTGFTLHQNGEHKAKKIE
jgi:CubicO group peptidase (beta-lactamase class C family)